MDQLSARKKNTPKKAEKARQHALKVTIDPDWCQEISKKFEGLDPSLCLNMNIEEIDGVEGRRYWDTHLGDDLSRARFESWGTEIGSALNPTPDVEPFEHFCYELRKDQEENNEDYRRRPAGNEVVSTTKVRTGGEVRKEDRAGLANWSKALRAAEDIIKKAALEGLERRPQKVKAPRARIVKRRIAKKTVFEKAIEIAPSYGVPKQVIRAIKQAKYVLKTERTTCTIPNAGQAAAAFCTRIADRAKVGPHRKRQYTRKGLVPKELNDMVIQLWGENPDWTHIDMCKRLDCLVDENSVYAPLPAWGKKAGEKRLWTELVDHSTTKRDVRPFLSGRKKKAFSTHSI